MNGPFTQAPEDWPLDREPEYLEAKLAPFEDHVDWQQKRGDERSERLGDSGSRLLSRLGDIQTFMQEYDMTPEEAARCLEHEIEVFRDDA